MKLTRLYLLFILALFISFSSCKTRKNDPGSFEELIEIRTDSGTMILKLYDETPLHKANFLKLVNEKFYDSLLFHRVIQGFMIQGGDPESKFAPPDKMLGGGDVGYKIPAEINPRLYHKKGVIAAARDGNPEKASSGCQFYIVQGSGPIDSIVLSLYAPRTKFAYSDTMQKIYGQIGGTPFLDNNYTVFGEVVSGLEVVDKIASMKTSATNRPFENIRMYIRVIKVKKTVLKAKK